MVDYPCNVGLEKAAAFYARRCMGAIKIWWNFGRNPICIIVWQMTQRWKRASPNSHFGKRKAFSRGAHFDHSSKRWRFNLASNRHLFGPRHWVLTNPVS
jgi:hypothetical protein